MPKEIWKRIAVEPWSDRYEISNLGRIRCAPIEVKQHLANGYAFAPLNARGVKKPVAVHWLMAETFIGPRPSKKHVVNHKNHNPADSRIKNLEWITYSENTLHGLKDCPPIRSFRKLIPELVFLKHKDGQSLTEIAKEFKVTVQCVSQMIKKYNMNKIETAEIGEITKQRYTKKYPHKQKIDKDDAVAMYIGGSSAHEIAKKYNCNATSVRKLLRKKGVYKPAYNRVWKKSLS